jgi:hypothetical protein
MLRIQWCVTEHITKHDLRDKGTSMLGPERVQAFEFVFWMVFEEDDDGTAIISSSQLTAAANERHAWRVITTWDKKLGNTLGGIG